MNEIEKLEKAIEGIQAKIQIQKAENQKLRNSLNEIEMNKSNGMKEVQRLKDVNISLENNIKETKQQIQEQDNKEIVNYTDRVYNKLECILNEMLGGN